MPRRLRKMVENANAKINQGGEMMTKVDILLSAFLEEFKPEDVEKLDVALDQAGHTLSLVYAVTEDVKPGQVRKIKKAAKEMVAKVGEFTAATKATLDQDGDNDVDITDLKVLVVDILPWPLDQLSCSIIDKLKAATSRDRES